MRWLSVRCTTSFSAQLSQVLRALDALLLELGLELAPRDVERADLANVLFNDILHVGQLDQVVAQRAQQLQLGSGTSNGELHRI